MRIFLCDFIFNEAPVVIFGFIFKVFLDKVIFFFYVRVMIRLVISDLFKINWLSVLLSEIMKLPIVKNLYFWISLWTIIWLLTLNKTRTIRWDVYTWNVIYLKHWWWSLFTLFTCRFFATPAFAFTWYSLGFNRFLWFGPDIVFTDWILLHRWFFNCIAKIYYFFWFLFVNFLLLFWQYSCSYVSCWCRLFFLYVGFF